MIDFNTLLNEALKQLIDAAVTAKVAEAMAALPQTQVQTVDEALVKRIAEDVVEYKFDNADWDAIVNDNINKDDVLYDFDISNYESEIKNMIGDYDLASEVRAVVREMSFTVEVD